MIRALEWLAAHPRVTAAIGVIDTVLGRPVARHVQRTTEAAALRMQIRACGGSVPKDEGIDALRWRLRRLTLVGNDKPGMESAAARLATWFAIDEGTASRILVAVRDDEERAVKVLLSAEVDDIGLVEALESVDMWAATCGAQRLLLAWRLAAFTSPPDIRLFWALKIARAA